MRLDELAEFLLRVHRILSLRKRVGQNAFGHGNLLRLIDPDFLIVANSVGNLGFTHLAKCRDDCFVLGGRAVMLSELWAEDTPVAVDRIVSYGVPEELE